MKLDDLPLLEEDILIQIQNFLLLDFLDQLG
jgi:hypothetical protein